MWCRSRRIDGTYDNYALAGAYLPEVTVRDIINPFATDNERAFFSVIRKLNNFVGAAGAEYLFNQHIISFPWLPFIIQVNAHI